MDRDIKADVRQYSKQDTCVFRRTQTLQYIMVPHKRERAPGKMGFKKCRMTRSGTDNTF